MANNIVASCASCSETDQTYVTKACNSTLYLEDCNKSLLPYSTEIKSNPENLCKYSLYVAIVAARDAYSTASKIPETKNLTFTDKKVIKDCKSNLKDSVEELQQSKDTMDSLNRNSTTSPDEAKFQMESIKTWASAALTDDGTCADEIDEEKVDSTLKAKLKASIVKVSRSASILLAIINGYCSDN